MSARQLSGQGFQRANELEHIRIGQAAMTAAYSAAL